MQDKFLIDQNFVSTKNRSSNWMAKFQDRWFLSTKKAKPESRWRSRIKLSKSIVRIVLEAYTSRGEIRIAVSKSRRGAMGVCNLCVGSRVTPCPRGGEAKERWRGTKDRRAAVFRTIRRWGKESPFPLPLPPVRCWSRCHGVVLVSTSRVGNRFGGSCSCNARTCTYRRESCTHTHTCKACSVCPAAEDPPNPAYYTGRDTGLNIATHLHT